MHVYIYQRERKRVLDEEQFKLSLFTDPRVHFTMHFSFIVHIPVLSHKLSLRVNFLLFDYTQRTSLPYPQRHSLSRYHDS